MKSRFPQFTRNTLLFLGGLGGVAHETILTHSERPTLLILFAAMMGLPAFLTPSSFSRPEADPTENEKALEREQRRERDQLEKTQQEARARLRKGKDG